MNGIEGYLKIFGFGLACFFCIIASFRQLYWLAKGTGLLDLCIYVLVALFLPY